VAKQLAQVGCHRVVVMGADGKELQNIVSQSSIVRFLDKHKDKLGKVGETTVAEAHECGTSPVLAVRATATVLDTLRVMAANDLLGLAVVDETTGCLVASTSAADFKKFLQDPSVAELEAPIVDFLFRMQGNLDVPADQMVTVSESDTLADVVATLAAARVHRVYVVRNGEPTRVISLTDVLQYIYRTSYAKFPIE
jgi:CBS domain-containing protein